MDHYSKPGDGNINGGSDQDAYKYMGGDRM